MPQLSDPATDGCVGVGSQRVWDNKLGSRTPNHGTMGCGAGASLRAWGCELWWDAHLPQQLAPCSEKMGSCHLQLLHSHVHEGPLARELEDTETHFSRQSLQGEDIGVPQRFVTLRFPSRQPTEEMATNHRYTYANA